MKRKQIRKVIGIGSAVALTLAILPMGAHAGVKVPKSEDTLTVALPIALEQSFFVEVGDQSVNTPTFSDGNVSLHYIMEGESGDTVIEGPGTDVAPTTYCDDKPNSPDEVLRIYKENAHGSLDVDALVSGTTTNTATGATEPWSERLPEEGTIHLAAGQSGGSTPILRICQ